MTWLYFISHEDKRFCKVGITNNHPTARLASLQGANPEKLILIGAFKFKNRDEAYFMEQQFLERFDVERVRGEWIYADPHFIMSHISDVMKFDNDTGEDRPLVFRPIEFTGIGSTKKTCGLPPRVSFFRTHIHEDEIERDGLYAPYYGHSPEEYRRLRDEAIAFQKETRH